MARHRGGRAYALSLGAFWSYAPHLKTAADNTKVKGRVLKSGQDCFTQKGKENASELGSQVVKQTNSRTSLKMARQAAPRTHLPTETSQTNASRHCQTWLCENAEIPSAVGSSLASAESRKMD